MSGWATGYSFRCDLVDYSRSPKALRVSNVMQLFCDINFQESFFLFTKLYCLRRRTASNRVCVVKSLTYQQRHEPQSNECMQAKLLFIVSCPTSDCKLAVIFMENLESCLWCCDIVKQMCLYKCITLLPSSKVQKSGCLPAYLSQRIILQIN